MNMRRTGGLVLIVGALALSGCAVVPVHDDRYGYRHYERQTIITTAPRVEYRGYPPAAGHIWIDGYWNRIGERRDWVPGHWAPPRARPIVQHRYLERDRDDDRRPRGWDDHRKERSTHDGRRQHRDDRRDGAHSRDAGRDRDLNRDRVKDRSRTEERKREGVREHDRRTDADQVRAGAFPVARPTPHQRRQAESERGRAEGRAEGRARMHEPGSR